MLRGVKAWAIRLTLLWAGWASAQGADSGWQAGVVLANGSMSSNQSGEGEQSRGAVGDWDLGYCLSGHRSQGSQWPWVIVLVDRAGAMVQSRNWTYTVISRAEKATFVVGSPSTVQQSMRRDGLTGRVTLLVDEIRRISGARRKLTVDEVFAGAVT